ncbi:metallophosphoesterase [Pseudomonas sp. DR 5-09]|uniref:metallophosphoesterase n=1 Tax=Pseudomonas sp. DR 5-09 TaxID=1534110 RepID=UPI0007DDF1E3|nr:metallophosphoesterase [Pseudomonas sp. DR 5-09]ANI55276.1 hypothetical protein PDR5_35460 [Pseudomonas sp. DR 5-09]
MKREWQGVLLALFSVLAMSKVTADPISTNGERLSVFISDLHFGLGHISKKQWHPYEDFRWSQALKGFLASISKEGNDSVDLVILGDFLEMWQLPDDIKCEGSGAGAGCSINELVDLSTRITQAHAGDFEALKNFSLRGSNRIHVVPGNHDAALLIPQVWAPVAKELGGDSGRIIFVRKGVWTSEDHQVLAEHGQQIGSDVNAFKDWPVVTTEAGDGQLLMIRPWGERFVQRLFNAEEVHYPIIDNLNPESAGARYRMDEQGIFGTAADIAKFIAFNIFETSWAQKSGALTQQPGEDQEFDRDAALRRGYLLFGDSLPDGDSSKMLLDKPDAAGSALRSELTQLLTTMNDEDLRLLCASAALNTGGHPCRSSLTSAIAGAFVPLAATLKKHLNSREAEFGKFDVFVYGHTHLWVKPWPLDIGNGRLATVVNTGAFQRLIEDEAFKQLAKDRNITPVVALQQLQPEDLKPCYSAVFIKGGRTPPEPELKLWEMAETGGGRYREPGVMDCR